jgi:hypothetical protein
MSLALTVGKGAVSSVVSYLKGQLDPDKRRRLDQEIQDYVLAELPRIVLLLEERCADLEARGCTPVEAVTLAHQVIEAQKRTLDEEKQARLTNVLINGFAAHHWDKVKHRLMVRYVVELEEEHIERLKAYASDEFRSHAETAAARRAEEERLHIEGDDAVFRHWTLRGQINRALDRELLGRGLLDEQRQPRMVAKRGTRGDVLVKNEVMQVRLTALGETFLDYLRTP